MLQIDRGLVLQGGLAMMPAAALISGWCVVAQHMYGGDLLSFSLAMATTAWTAPTTWGAALLNR
jgi:hypothetical protein